MVNPKTETEIKLAEYNATQNSAQHHDNLMWTVTSILLVSSIGLRALIEDPLSTNCEVRFVIGIMNVLLLLGLFIFARGFREIKITKYKRLRELERDLGMKQHLNVYETYTPRMNRYFYFLIFVIIVVWVYFSLTCY